MMHAASVTRGAMFVAALALLVAACTRKADSTDTAASGSATTQDIEMAPLVVKDDTEGLTFTWIDEKGDFHRVYKAMDVPLAGRDVVRVQDPEREEGNSTRRSAKVFVVDLRAAGADGTYPMKTLTREEFDEVALARRERHGPTLANARGGQNERQPDDSRTTAPSRPGRDEPSDKTPPATGRAAVIIYGAEWCGPCHQAQAYLKGKGIPFVYKDVDKDPEAAREMSQKLAKVGQHGGSIPVVDVRGKIMVGFSPSAVEQALGKSL